MEGKNEYDCFVLNEPWDGPHNRELSKGITLSALVFQCPHRRWRDGTSVSYLALAGPGTAWPGATGSKPADFRHGPANTILLVEVAASGISWAEPRDLDIRELLSATSGLRPSSNHGRGGFHALFADGSVRYLDWNRLRARLGPDGAVKGDPKDCEIAFPPGGY
jgi:prepilin-type processing-associated H-X9-DG protein